MISRLFAPVSMARLFDPMPLPRAVRRHTVKVRINKGFSALAPFNFSRIVRKVR